MRLARVISSAASLPADGDFGWKAAVSRPVAAAFFQIMHLRRTIALTGGEMRIGLLVLTVFAAAWASAGLLVSGGRPWLILFPIAVSLALLAWGWRGAGLVGSSRPHVGKLVGVWSSIEGVAILVVVNVLENLHHDDLVFPAIVIIVGLHFFPLARGLPRPSYYATGAALVFTGLAALLVHAEQRPITVGMSAALILWVTSVPLILRARRSPTTSGAPKSDAIPPLG